VAHVGQETGFGAISVFGGDEKAGDLFLLGLDGFGSRADGFL
jgi:hypothetical protein